MGDKGRTLTVDDWLRETYTDAVVMLLKCRVVFERDINGMQPEAPHVLFFITKNFTGLLAAQLVRRVAWTLGCPWPAVCPKLKAAPGAT